MKISRRTLLKLFGGASAGLFVPLIFASEPKTKYYGRFRELPVGSVKPQGWIKSWLERQAEGLSGHPENLAYPYDTCLLNGKIPPSAVPHGEAWWRYEQSGYFIDAAVRLNYLIDNSRIKSIAEANIDYLLKYSGANNLGASETGWSNAVIGRSLIAYHSASGAEQAAQILETYLKGNHSLNSRDGFIFEQALYLYGLNGDQKLLEIATKDYENYFLSDAQSFSHLDKISGADPLKEHGVTAAEQLKLLPLMYSYTGNQQALELANAAYRKILDNSLMPDGGIVSSESLGTTAFNSLHESCNITDWSWSFGYMLMAGGDGSWADRIEQMTFNALPGAVSK